MRLIDADALCERIRKIYDGYMLDEGCTPIEFENMVDERPTAYDVEKVVAELERLRIDESNYFGVLNIVAEKYDRANEMLDDAIDIVRKGGVE